MVVPLHGDRLGVAAESLRNLEDQSHRKGLELVDLIERLVHHGPPWSSNSDQGSATVGNHLGTPCALPGIRLWHALLHCSWKWLHIGM